MVTRKKMHVFYLNSYSLNLQIYYEKEIGNMSESGLKEQITGKVEKKKGQIKEGIGEVTEDRELKNEGKWEKTKGTVKEKVGKVKQKISDGLDNKE
jgi:uncharacterized protein YjbJ (UPF0337 family)